MGAHIDPCDAETNGGDCSCAETWKERYEDALRRAAGHAYASGMAEAGEDLQHQELVFERKQHAETMTHFRRYETALTSIAKNTCCDGCQEAKRVAQVALAEDS